MKKNIARSIVIVFIAIIIAIIIREVFELIPQPFPAYTVSVFFILIGSLCMSVLSLALYFDYQENKKNKK